MKINGFQNYLEYCKKFAEDSHEWAALDEFQFYTTHPLDGWRESCDNAHGGMDVRWAFHCPESEIELLASRQFAEQIGALIEQTIDEDGDFSGVFDFLNFGYSN